jgi:D-proline reductase (dithiol) PrdB
MYEAWWPAAEPLIRQHQYREAFKTHVFPKFETAPWTPPAKPLSRARVALVTTAAIFRKGADKPFDTEDPEGDLSFRRIPAEVDPAALDLRHGHIPEEIAREDINTVFPLWRLRELHREGLVGGIAPTHYSLLGYNTRAADLAEHMAPAIAALMHAEGVDLAVIAPV